ncbi:pilus assembly protein [Cohnella laeviribosi]|uniref:pilus assembly protein n=1 Tax=Cohnella laeviribosi TaxID=380174 RepID=UPI003D1B1258
MSSLKLRFAPLIRRLRDNSGSFALESSMVMPIVLMMTFLLLFFAIYIAQGAIMYYNVSIAGERAAYNWPNSAKDVRTGAYPAGQYDGLYWRLTDDHVLSGLFGLALESPGAAVAIPAAGGAEAGDLADRKLLAAAGTIVTASAGEMRYRHSLVWREIGTEAASSDVPEPLRRFNGTTILSAKASAIVVEPAEFLRNIDLLRYYAAKMRSADGGAAAYREQAAAVLTGGAGR